MAMQTNVEVSKSRITAGKQRVSDLAFTDRDWTQFLPEGYRVELRIDSKTMKEHKDYNGRITVCSDLQWHLGGRDVPGTSGSTLKMVDPNGIEVAVKGWRRG